MKAPGATGAVVVGVDGSPASANALDWASQYASMTRRRLLAVHGTVPAGGQATARQIVAAAYAALDTGHALVVSAISRVRRSHFDVPVEGMTRIGDPAAVLVEESKTAAVLVIGHRRRRVLAPLRSSYTSRVISHAKCPVVVHADENVISSPQPSFVGLVLDSRVASCEPAYFAFQYAALTTLPLLIVYTSQEKAVRSPLLSVLDSDLERGLTREEELSIGEVIAGLPEVFPEVEVHRARRPVRDLTDAMATAKLVVVGVQRKRLARRSLQRSVTMRLIEKADCPVAVVPA